MAKAKNENPEKRSFIRYALIATAVIVLFLFVKRDNIITWIGTAFTLNAQEKYIESLKQSNASLDEQIHKLSKDRDSLEFFARETFQFAASGDDVYIVETE